MKIADRFLPGSLRAIVTLHAKHYATHRGFGTFFEAKVAREIAEFSGLQPARHLYESFGFTLISGEERQAGGTRVKEQKFCR